MACHSDACAACRFGLACKRFGNQRVDLLRMKDLPPFAGDVAAHGELLRCAAGASADAVGARMSLGRVAAARRGWRRREIGTDRAGRKERQGERGNAGRCGRKSPKRPKTRPDARQPTGDAASPNCPTLLTT